MGKFEFRNGSHVFPSACACSSVASCPRCLVTSFSIGVLVMVIEHSLLQKRQSIVMSPGILLVTWGSCICVG